VAEIPGICCAFSMAAWLWGMSPGRGGAWMIGSLGLWVMCRIVGARSLIVVGRPDPILTPSPSACCSVAARRLAWRLSAPWITSS
jgi:hypothetical protein